MNALSHTPHTHLIGVSAQRERDGGVGTSGYRRDDLLRHRLEVSGDGLSVVRVSDLVQEQHCGLDVVDVRDSDAQRLEASTNATHTW